MRKAIFLDRDGTLNEDPGYLCDPRQLNLIPQVPQALKILKQCGFDLVVVTNQSGIARGFLTHEVLENIHSYMNELLKEYGVQIKDFLVCPHHPDEKCFCRKPSPKLVLDYARNTQTILSASYFIGDRYSDVDCGKNAGCKNSLLVGTGKDQEQLRDSRELFFPNLYQAALFIKEECENEK